MHVSLQCNLNAESLTSSLMIQITWLLSINLSATQPLTIAQVRHSPVRIFLFKNRANA